MSTTTISTCGGGKLKQERPPAGAPHDSSAGNHNDGVSTNNAKPAATLRPTENLSARNNASASTTTLLVEGVGPSWRPDDSSHVPTDRQRQWAGLLHSRPASDDMDGMSIWLLQVMAISDCNNNANNANKNDTSVATKTNSGDDPMSSLSSGGRSSTTSSSSSSSSEDIKKEGNNRKKRRKLGRMQGKDGGDK
jgi:hypothetical protein